MRTDDRRAWNSFLNLLFVRNDSPGNNTNGTKSSEDFSNFHPHCLPEKATKHCGEKGQWFRHPDTNRTWSNYTACNANTKEKLKVGPPQGPGQIR